jgi:ferritin-like metal-binding protein YciE
MLKPCSRVIINGVLNRGKSNFFIPTAGSRKNVQAEETQEPENELRELFLDELADVYNAELQLTKVLPKMAKAAESDELREALESHLEETKNHLSRLDDVAKSLDKEIERKTCKAMKGLVEEGEEIMKDLKDSSALDAGLIAAAQKVEHYEIATYGTLRTWAEQLGEDEAVQLLTKTEEEEKAADEELTEIADSIANERAKAE